MKITIIGATYIGLPLAVLLGQNNNVTILDSDIEKVTKINRKENPLNEKNIEKYLNSQTCNLKASLTREETFLDTEYVIIALETFYDSLRETFNVAEIEKIIKKINNVNDKCLIIICSSIPVGYTSLLRKKFNTDKIIYVPEFLVEEDAVRSYTNPQKIIIGAAKSNNKQINYAETVAQLFLSISENKMVPILHTTSVEAETIKLFSNTYIAMRTGFFNFVDTYTSCKRINTEKVIEGLLLDPIVGKGKNQILRYGAYYLPTTTKRLVNNLEDDYVDPITLILNGNAMKKEIISDKINDESISTVGIYKMFLKDRYKTSLLTLINQLTSRGIKVVIFEPKMKTSIYEGCRVIKSFESFKNNCNIIIAEKITDELICVADKIYTF